MKQEHFCEVPDLLDRSLAEKRLFQQQALTRSANRKIRTEYNRNHLSPRVYQT